MNGSYRLRILLAVGAFGIWSITAPLTMPAQADPASSGNEGSVTESTAPDAGQTVPAGGGCMEDGKPCCAACQKRAELLGDKAKAAGCPCKARAEAAARAAGEAAK